MGPQEITGQSSLGVLGLQRGPVEVPLWPCLWEGMLLLGKRHLSFLRDKTEFNVGIMWDEISLSP